MPDVDTKLAEALKQARRAPMNFAFVAKGAAEGKLLVAKKPIPAKEVAEAKKDVGGGLVFRGRCLGEEGKLIFELPREPPATLAKQLKAVITKDAGLTLKVEIRVAADLAEEEAGAAADQPAAAPASPPPPPPPPPAVDKAAVLKRLAALAGPYKEALARKGPDGPRLQQLFGAIKGLLDKQDFERAGKVLDALEPLLAQAKTAPAAPPPPGDGAARFMARLKALMPGLQKAMAGTSPLCQELKQRASEAQGFGRKQDFVQANAVLDQVEDLLKRCLAESAATRGAFSLVKLGKARVEWIAVRSQAVRDIERLKAAIEAQFKDDQEQQAQLAAALTRLDSLITALNEDLGNQLDAVLNAKDDGQRQALARTAQATMARFVQFVDSDEIMAELDGNEVLPDLQITGPLRAKLRDIASGLGVG